MSRHISTPPTSRIVGFPQARFRFHEQVCIRCGVDAGTHGWCDEHRTFVCDDLECRGPH